MGISIVQKSNLSQNHADTKKALVLAGGAISGGAFKLGGLAALDRYLSNHSVTQFDVYMGISAGAFLAAPIASGIEPMEIVEAFVGEPRKMSRFSPWNFYNLNVGEFWRRPFSAMKAMALSGPRASLSFLKSWPRKLPDLTKEAMRFLADPTLENAEAVAKPILDAFASVDWPKVSWFPSGVFDNAPIERYIRQNLEDNGATNHFRRLKLETGKSLYIGATNIDTAQGVLFGHDEDSSVTISEAVQASTAIPGFFKPVRLGPPGREQYYVDAAVRKTANISVAVKHGAQLVICYNPFRPFVNYQYRVSRIGGSISDLSMAAVINQSFRTLLYSRLRLGIEKLRMNESFRGDVILIEPAETDASFFAVNPLAFSSRQKAAELGFQSVRQSLVKHHESLQRILGAYGIEVDPSAMGTTLRQPIEDEIPSISPKPRSHLRLVSGQG